MEGGHLIFCNLLTIFLKKIFGLVFWSNLDRREGPAVAVMESMFVTF